MMILWAALWCSSQRLPCHTVRPSSVEARIMSANLSIDYRISHSPQIHIRNVLGSSCPLSAHWTQFSPPPSLDKLLFASLHLPFEDAKLKVCRRGSVFHWEDQNNYCLLNGELLPWFWVLKLTKSLQLLLPCNSLSRHKFPKCTHLIYWQIDFTLSLSTIDCTDAFLASLVVVDQEVYLPAKNS